MESTATATAVPTQPLAPTPYRCPVCGRMSPAGADAPVRPGCYACGTVGTARSLAAALSISTDRFVMVPSDSTPGVEYKCSAKGCGCAAFYFGRLKNPAFRCKHMIRKFPPTRFCPVCHLNPITDLSTCSDKCSRAARKLDMAIRVDTPVVVEQPRPVCPGFLKQHAPQDGLVYFWCAACDCEAA